MAENPPLSHRDTATNTDDEENEFEFRQRVSKAYAEIGTLKKRLRFWNKFQIVLGLLMAAKLTPHILDRADIFVLYLEELEIPAPLLWEYGWLLGCLSCLLGLKGIKKNQVVALRMFLAMQTLFGLLMLLFCFGYYFAETMAYIFGPTTAYSFFEFETIQYWEINGMKLPWGVLNYIFVVVAVQAHGFNIYNANKLVILLELKGNKKKRE